MMRENLIFEFIFFFGWLRIAYLFFYFRLLLLNFNLIYISFSHWTIHQLVNCSWIKHNKTIKLNRIHLIFIVNFQWQYNEHCMDFALIYSHYSSSHSHTRNAKKSNKSKKIISFWSVSWESIFIRWHIDASLYQPIVKIAI